MQNTAAEVTCVPEAQEWSCRQQSATGFPLEGMGGKRLNRFFYHVWSRKGSAEQEQVTEAETEQPSQQVHKSGQWRRAEKAEDSENAEQGGEQDVREQAEGLQRQDLWRKQVSVGLQILHQ